LEILAKTDQEAINACRAGDKEMYRVLVERYKTRAYYAALMYTHNRDDALDLSQEAFYRAYKALDRFNNSKNFYTWFYKILKNICINFVTRKKTHNQVSADREDRPELVSSAPNPEEILERSEQSELLWKAIHELKEKDKEIIILKEFQEMSYQDIAEVLNIPQGSVMSRLYYARQRLLKEVEYLSDGR